jgi:hypothetical protein
MSKAGEDIFWRQILAPLDDLPPVAAREILRMKLGKSQVARINRLLARSGEGVLSEQEQAELDGYLQFGNLLTLMHSKARIALHRRDTPTRRKSA